MPEPNTITRATLQTISWDSQGQAVNPGDEFEVQFNPETLKLTMSNQVAGGNQAGGSAIQFNSKGTTKLAFDLVFDATDPKIATKFSKRNKPSSTNDVRKITAKVLAFMETTPEGSGDETRYVPPGVRFVWGSFKFEGVMTSINETLDFFSAEGLPLRSTVSVGLTRQDVEPQFANGANNENPGTQNLPAAQEDDTMASVLARAGDPEKWHGDALANQIENPRRIPVGQPLQIGSKVASAVNNNLAGGNPVASQAISFGEGVFSNQTAGSTL